MFRKRMSLLAPLCPFECVLHIIIINKSCMELTESASYAYRADCVYVFSPFRGMCSVYR